MLGPLMSIWASGAPAPGKEGSAQWSQVSSPTENVLLSVYMLSSNDGWAVGREGTIVKWNGLSWLTISSPTINHLSSIHALSPSEAWAVGGHGTILRWDGSQWSMVEGPDFHLYSIHMLSPSEGWAVGNWGTILKYGEVAEAGKPLNWPLILGVAMVICVVGGIAIFMKKRSAGKLEASAPKEPEAW